MVLYIIGDYEDALNDILRSQSLKPAERNTLLLKGAILEALGRHEEAEKTNLAADRLPESRSLDHYPMQDRSVVKWLGWRPSCAPGRLRRMV